jgi:hypothetical protein
MAPEMAEYPDLLVIPGLPHPERYLPSLYAASQDDKTRLQTKL